MKVAALLKGLLKTGGICAEHVTHTGGTIHIKTHRHTVARLCWEQ